MNEFVPALDSILLQSPSYLLPGCFSFVVELSLIWRLGPKISVKAKGQCGSNFSWSHKGPTLEIKLPSFSKCNHVSLPAGTDLVIVHSESRQNGWVEEINRKLQIVKTLKLRSVWALGGPWWQEPIETSVDSQMSCQTHSMSQGHGNSALWSLCVGLRGSSPELCFRITNIHTNSVNTECLLCHLELVSWPITLNMCSLDHDYHCSGPREMLSLSSCPVSLKAGEPVWMLWRFLGFTTARVRRCFGVQGRFEWQKCLSKRKKQINYLVKFLLSYRTDAVDFCVMNTGFLVVLTAHFLASLSLPICGSRGTPGSPTVAYGN